MTIELIRKSDSKEHTYNALVEKAKALGYFHKEEDECPVCGGVRIKFNKTNRPYLYACVNGHRWAQDKWEPNKNKCKTPGCTSTIYKREMELNDGYCWNCRPYEGQGEPTTEKKPIKFKDIPTGKEPVTENKKPIKFKDLPANKDSKEAAQQGVVM